MSDLMSSLLGFIDTNQLAYTEEAREGLNRGRLIQGNPEFEKDAALNQTARYLGGIGLSVEGLSEENIAKGTIVTMSEKDFAVFTSLEVVVLASSRIRRFFAEIEGNMRLACGTNQDGANAKGWSGTSCKTCPYFPKNYEGDRKDACKASVAALVYIPSMDHITILSFQGTSYMEATAWLDQIARLSKSFAQKPEVQANSPGLARVNPWFFKTTLSAGAYEKDADGNKYQRLQFTKAEQPYAWEQFLNTPDTLKRIQAVWKDLEPSWKQLYVEHNASAAMSLPSADAVAALSANSSAAQPAALISTVTVPEAAPATQPVAPAQPAIAQEQQQSQTVPGVVTSQITLDDADDAAAASLPPIDVPMGF